MIWQSFILVIIGLAMLVYGADVLVKGASRLALIFGMSPLLIGLTVVSFGTSAPELAISMFSSFQGVSELALGNVIGSNLFNTLAILGITALVTPILVHQKLLRIEVPFMIIVSLLTWFMSIDGQISRWEGGILFALLVAYLGYCGVQSNQEDSAVLSEYEAEFGQKDTPKSRSKVWNGFLLIFGILLLVGGSRALVHGAVDIAKTFGVSELVIGLTIVSIGTSLPELATSVIAAFKGEQDIAVGNIIGSNLFNLLAVLGLTTLISPNSMPASEHVIYFDLIFMIASAIACLPIFFTSHKISRLEGFIFLFFYLAYMAYTILYSQQSEHLTLYKIAVFGFLGPVIIITLFINAVRHYSIIKSNRA